MIPEPLFNIFGIEIDMYAICFLVGLIACFVFTYIAMRKSGYSSSARDTILIIGFFAISLGLLFAVFTQSIYDFIANPSEGFKITGKMENNIFKSDMNKGVWELLMFVPISITLAHAFGRLGCFCAGCCGGIETDLWFGVQFPGEHVKHVPTQLFGAIFLFITRAVMILLYFKFKFKYNMTVYLIGYGIWRFLIEFVRDDDRGQFIPGLTPSQFWSILMVIGGIAFFFLYRYFDKKIQEKKQVITK